MEANLILFRTIILKLSLFNNLKTVLYSHSEKIQKSFKRSNKTKQNKTTHRAVPGDILVYRKT